MSLTRFVVLSALGLCLMGAFFATVHALYTAAAESMTANMETANELIRMAESREALRR